jgi:nitroreductase
MVAHGIRWRAMDAFLAVASRREVRRYADRPIPPEVEQRILEAGRVSGSSQNRQPWRFVVVASPEARERTAAAVWAGDNVRGAALVIAVIVAGKGPVSFDAGRAAQNMLLAAWNDGVGSCPNGIKDPEAAARICGGEVKTILSFGYPAKPRDPQSRSAEEWSAQANRKPLDELIRRR